MPVALSSGDRGRREEMAELGATGLPSPADFCALFSQLTKRHPTPELPVRGSCFCTQLIVLEKGLGCSGCTPKSCFSWCTAQDRELTGGELL